eukprot:6476635-Amphidinium_carterae.1
MARHLWEEQEAGPWAGAAVVAAVLSAAVGLVAWAAVVAAVRSATVGLVAVAVRVVPAVLGDPSVAAAGAASAGAWAAAEVQLRQQLQRSWESQQAQCQWEQRQRWVRGYLPVWVESHQLDQL